MGETIGVNVLKRASNMEISQQFDGYSAVRIYVGTDDNGNRVVYEAGNTDGRTLDIQNPFGTQTMANNILADIQGYQYQPFSADNALLNPASEMGDGVTVNGVYSGIFVRATQFGQLMASNIAAPTDEEIEHEFAVESASDRQYTRFVQQTKSMLKITNTAIEAEVEERKDADEQINATLLIQATQIQAKVNKQSPDGQSSFGWNLTDSEWTVFSGSLSNVILRASSSGLTVKGRIEADEGYIGGTNGFVITANKIYKNISSYGGTQSTGVYIGTNGIQLGQNFKVSSSGNVTANNMKLTGTLTVGSSTITADNLRQGASDGYNWSNGAYNGYASQASYALTGANRGISAKSTWDTARNVNGNGVSLVHAQDIITKDLSATGTISLSDDDLYIGGYNLSVKSIDSCTFVLGW